VTIRAVALGAALTSQERRVRDLVVDGMTTEEIAALLCLGKRTVETHRQVVHHKMGARNVADIVRLTLQQRCRCGSLDQPGGDQPYDTVL
jgi:FixJ family two-component response regulator